MANLALLTKAVSLLNQSVLMKSLYIKNLRCLSSVPSSFKYADLTIEKTTTFQEKPDWNNLVFGKELSDHMLEVEWSSTRGWGKPRIVPYHNFSISPAAKCFHYAVELFEGMKAYYGVDNKVRLFRPLENMKRMNMSAERACLPAFDNEELKECIKKLVSIDNDWVPRSDTSSLYIRPTLIGVEPSLGVANSQDALLYVITGPVGAYFPTGLKPVSLLADPKFVRAWPGGSGNSKMGSNYGPTIYIQKIANSMDCQQVLWLYGNDHQLTEVGTMNILVYWTNEKGEKELITPPLDSGVILPGVTRQSLLDLARKWGEFKVSEKAITMPEVTKALKENRLLEMFGAGTACVVCPVERIHYAGEDLMIPTMSNGAPLTMRFFNELMDIQYGRTSPPFTDWIDIVD